MAVLTLHADRLHHNFRVLNDLFTRADASWSIVTKLLCGHEEFTREVLSTGIASVCDSRLTNIRAVARIAPELERCYIKPPPKLAVKGVAEYCDASFNSELRTIAWLSQAAQRLGKTHGVIVMVEGGDLREGVSSESVLLDLCKAVTQLPNIELLGLGTNFNCLSGVLPTQEAMERLVDQARRVERHVGRELPLITAGSSVVIPSLLRGEVPTEMNHWRIGESLFFGNDLITGDVLPNMEANVFTLEAQIIEVGVKPTMPVGPVQTPPFGAQAVPKVTNGRSTSRRAIVNLGMLDVGNLDTLRPLDPGAHIVGGSSDMVVVDIDEAHGQYTVGATMSFHPGYTNVLSLMNSRYVEKRVADSVRADPERLRALQEVPDR
jgi:ornithine racemase